MRGKVRWHTAIILLHCGMEMWRNTRFTLRDTIQMHRAQVQQGHFCSEKVLYWNGEGAAVSPGAEWLLSGEQPERQPTPHTKVTNLYATYYSRGIIKKRKEEKRKGKCERD